MRERERHETERLLPRKLAKSREASNMGYNWSAFKNVAAWSRACLGRPAAVKTSRPA